DKADRLVLYNQATFGRIYSGAWKPPLGIRYAEFVAEMVGRGEILLDGRTAEDHVRDAVDARRQPEPPPREYRLRDGRWIFSSRRRTRDGGMVSILSDVTPLKTAQLAAEAAATDLTEKRQQLDTAVENIDQGVVFYDAKECLVLCNRR